jgi:translocator protein
MQMRIPKTKSLAIAETKMETRSWYSILVKPSWAPPSWLFGPVWSVLYLIIAVSYGRVAYLFFQKRIPFVVMLPFALNLFFNLIYSPIQFGTKNYWLATVDILLVLATLIWAVVAIYSYEKWISYANIPYLLWVSFATILQINITLLNR